MNTEWKAVFGLKIDAGVDGPHDPHTVFHGAEHADRQVLPLLSSPPAEATSEPSVVADVQQEVDTFLITSAAHKLAADIRHHVLIADRNGKTVRPSVPRWCLHLEPAEHFPGKHGVLEFAFGPAEGHEPVEPQI